MNLNNMYSRFWIIELDNLLVLTIFHNFYLNHIKHHFCMTFLVNSKETHAVD